MLNTKDLSQRINVSNPRSRSILYVVLQYDYGDKSSSIKIKNLKNGANNFEIPMGQCSGFGAILHRNKIYIMGGIANWSLDECANQSYLKSVGETWERK